MFYDLVETYWCVCDPSLSVPNLTWFVSYCHLTDRDVQISPCRLAAFLYSASIFLERKLHIFLICITIKKIQFFYTGVAKVTWHSCL